MHKAHAAIIALALGVAAVAGTFAALETTSLGAQAASGSGGGQLAVRKAKLDRAERKLNRAVKRRPPALPPIPAAASLSSGSGSSGPNPGPGGPVVSDDSGHNEFEDDEFDDDGHGRHHGGDDDRDDDRDDD